MSKKMKYEEAMAELQEIVRNIENENSSIDDLSKSISRAMELIKICKDKLFTTESEVQKALEELDKL